MVFDVDDVKIDVDLFENHDSSPFFFSLWKISESAQNFEVKISFQVMIFLSSFDDVTKWRQLITFLHSHKCHWWWQKRSIFRIFYLHLQSLLTFALEFVSSPNIIFFCFFFSMTVFRHHKCCDGWVFFLFLYSGRNLENEFSCLLKWKRDRGSILDVYYPVEKRRGLFFFLSRKQKRKNIAEVDRKWCWSSMEMLRSFSSGELCSNQTWWMILFNAEIFWFADGYSSYIVNVLMLMFLAFLTAEKFWNRILFLLACKVGIVDYVVVSDARIDDSSVERWLDAVVVD